MNLGELMRALAEAGVELSSEGANLRYRAPKGALSEALRLAIGEHRAALLKSLELRSSDRNESLSLPRDEASRYEPFPLTELQQAYWVGEQALFESAGAGYFYQEYRVEQLDLDRFRQAVGSLVERHDVLRLIVEDGGTQQRFARPGTAPAVPCLDRLEVKGVEVEASMRELRAELCAQLPSLSDGRPVSFFVLRFADQVRISVLIRLIAADGVSLHALYADLVALYAGTSLEPRDDIPSYRDWVMARIARTTSVGYRRSREYWNGRLRTLPGAPQLPSAGADARAHAARANELTRLHGALEPHAWRQLQERALKLGLPINTLLCSLFADCLRRWVTDESFTLNVLVASRPRVDPDVDRIVGNCSSTTLLEVAPCSADTTVVERARALQAQLFADLQHADVSGVTVIRELAKTLPRDGRPPMPVVFTSGLGLTADFRGFSLGGDGWRLVHSALRTPQVWLDHQVYEEGGALQYNWDFEPRELESRAMEGMFACYEATLAALVDDSAAWLAPDVPQLPASELSARERANQTDAPLPSGNLVSALLERMERADGDVGVAVVDSDRSLSYGELLTEAGAVAGGLRRLGCQAGDLVVICLDRGWRQAAAVLGVQLLGGAYVPVDSSTPLLRLEKILRHSGARALMASGSECATTCARAGVARFDVDVDMDVDALAYGIAPWSSGPDDLAYLIYTSGSTGEPKGVAMDHRAVLNTLVDIRRRFGLTASDRVLAISSLAFDLSVFDLFATFSVGASLIYPRRSRRPDPQALADAVRDHRVTVWNSVPALLEITCEYLGDRIATQLSSLRLILLSGDWIPLSLARLIRNALPHARLVSLGGATEAAIWSNYHEVDRIESHWSSIPYGRPLANQRLHVLDRQLRSVPCGVVGDLYISGSGLARGYHDAPELTRLSFIDHPHLAERIYRTGDLARYGFDGVVEFLGRSDSQVKLGGFRIELGEIESQLNSLPGVASAVVIATQAGAGSASRRLVGFIVEDETTRFDPEQSRRELAARLPHYMVPGRLERVAEIPLTSNGKVDRRQLQTMEVDRGAVGTSAPRELSDTQAALTQIWAALLQHDDVPLEANFFALGGDSLLAVRLFNRIERGFGLRLPLETLFEHATIAEQSRLIDDRVVVGSKVCIPLRTGDLGRAPIFLFHPVGGSLLCYRPLLAALPAHTPIYGFRSCGLEAGEEPMQSVQAMCDHYLPFIRELAPNGRAMLAGWSMGGVLALHAAHVLECSGVKVARVFAIDSWVAGEQPRAAHERDDFAEFRADLRGSSLEGPPSSAIERELGELATPAALSEPLGRAFAVFRSNARALRTYRERSQPNCVPVTYVEAARSLALHQWVRPFEHRGWRDAARRWQRLRVNADHYSVIADPAVRQYAGHLPGDASIAQPGQAVEGNAQ